MNISLTPELEKYVYEKLQRGFYSSVSEIIREALRSMLQRDASDQTRQRLNFDIERGLDDLHKERKIFGEDAYKKLRKKIDVMTKEK